MNWKENIKQGIALTFDLIKKQYKEIKFPCYGGMFYRRFLFRYFENQIYLFLTDNALVYTPSGVTFTEIPFSEITDLSIKLKGNKFHIKFIADKKYHLIIYISNWLFTDEVGSLRENAHSFVDELQSKVNSQAQVILNF